MSATGSQPHVRSSSTAMRAPMARKASMMPLRLGLTPTPVRRSSASGWAAAATIQKAAALMSPGTRRLRGVSSPVSGETRWPPSPATITAPMARSMRSVWSREGAGSSSTVSPSA